MITNKDFFSMLGEAGSHLKRFDKYPQNVNMVSIIKESRFKQFFLFSDIVKILSSSERS